MQKNYKNKFLNNNKSKKKIQRKKIKKNNKFNSLNYKIKTFNLIKDRNSAV